MQVEKRLNEQLRKQRRSNATSRCTSSSFPCAREALLASLIEGKGDIAARQPHHHGQAQAAGYRLHRSLLENVRELLVSGPSPQGGKRRRSRGQRVFVRPPSSYYESLPRLPQPGPQVGGRPSSTSSPPPEVLEDEDLVGDGERRPAPFIVMDEHKARFWKRFSRDHHSRHPVFREGRHRLGGAQGEPQLLAMLNEQIKALRGKATGTRSWPVISKQNKFVKAPPPRRSARNSCRWSSCSVNMANAMTWTGC